MNKLRSTSTIILGSASVAFILLYTFWKFEYHPHDNLGIYKLVSEMLSDQSFGDSYVQDQPAPTISSRLSEIRESRIFASIFAAYDKTHDLPDTLTIFLPTDRAFRDLAAELELSVGEMVEDSEKMDVIISNHLSLRIYPPDQLQTGVEVSTVYGEQLHVYRARDGQITLDGWAIVDVQDPAYLGMDAAIYLVDSILMP